MISILLGAHEREALVVPILAPGWTCFQPQ
jgi:hypothetical protein